MAAKHGHLACLEYMHDRGCSWDESTTAQAASGGHLHCLAYAHENGCPWDAYTSGLARRFAHMDCMQYAYERGCPGAHDTSGGRRHAAASAIGRFYKLWRSVRDADLRLALAGRRLSRF